jgi:hypothetical protein
MTIEKAIAASPYHGAWTVSISDGWSFEVYKETNRYTLSILKPGEPKEIKPFEKLSDLLKAPKRGGQLSLAHSQWYPIDDSYLSRT